MHCSTCYSLIKAHIEDWSRKYHTEADKSAASQRKVLLEQKSCREVTISFPSHSAQ